MDDTVVMKRMTKRITANKVWKTLFFLATTFALVTLAVLLYRIVTQGIDYLNIDFLTNFASRFADKAGIKAALIGTLRLGMVQYKIKKPKMVNEKEMTHSKKAPSRS